MNKKNGSATGYIILVIAVILVLAICAMIFGSNNMNNDSTTPDIYDQYSQGENAIENTMQIADANAKELYDRVKNGITLDGKLIEVPASYMKKITDKITKTGYKMADDTKTAINGKLDEVEGIIRSEGKTDINELSKDSQDKIKSIAKDIEDML